MTFGPLLELDSGMAGGRDCLECVGVGKAVQRAEATRWQAGSFGTLLLAWRFLIEKATSDVDFHSMAP